MFLQDEGSSERNLVAYMDKLREMDITRENNRNSINAYSHADRINSDIRLVERLHPHWLSDSILTFHDTTRFSIKSRLMDLRKTTNHPYLIEYPLTKCGQFYRSDRDMIDVCGKLKVLDQMLIRLMDEGHKVLIFSQMTKMLDILGDYLTFQEYK